MRPRAAAADAAFLLALAALALLGLGNTFAGRGYLWTGLAGVAAGALLAFGLRALRQPAIVLAAATVVVFFAAGVPVTRPGDAPSVPAVRALSESAVFGWKDLLTTLPPIDDARLLVVPWTLGLVCGVAGAAMSAALPPRRPRWVALWAAAPLAAPSLLLAAVLLFGTHDPVVPLASGAGFGALALTWAAWRRRRAAAAPAGGVRAGRAAVRALAAAAVLGLAALAGVAAAPVLGGDAGGRWVLRDQVVPPFDIGAYPSPLVGFRKYTKDANQLWDQELFRVEGLPEGVAVRIALLDDYDGSVWGAGSGGDGGYHRVGAAFGPTGDTVLRVTIAPAYAAAGDLNPWLPGAGRAGSIEFGGPRRAALADSLRVNLAAATGLSTARLAAGDTYTVRTAVRGAPDTVALPDNAQPAGRPALTESAQALLASKVAAWTKGTSGLSAQLRAVADYLRTNGAYSDGGPGETQYLPGHSLGRLATFFNAPRPVGDDEQYAAAYALVAGYLGIPSRVVLGARPGPGGVVRGSDVHAWVEVHLADGRWATVPQTAFMPDVTKRPEQRPPQAAENTDAIVVPPPNAAKQNTASTDTSRNDPRRSGGDPAPDPWWRRWWAAIAPVVTWGGPPVLAAALVVAGIVGWKARRRRRRRTRGTPAARYAGGWRELVDAARDAGAAAPAGHTRREEAARLGGDLDALAAAADAAVYGPGEPSPQDAALYWRDVERARRGLVGGRRLRAALSLRSLRPRRTAAKPAARPSATRPATRPAASTPAATRGAS
ncbi:transglutaminase-like domain-containing protein [Dactylosporangium sp. CA-139066]|uniref:transglutaminase-like domain-containing protein n=1 Tax=Dactylosporangium sp. CA-139066 TaxID=3239930 RepID=UPI003D94A7E4